MSNFGQRLRVFRNQCRDPLSGRPLSQARFGELIGLELGDAGYSGAAVSDWERGKSKINADDRRVLVAIPTVLHKYAGLHTVAEADELLTAGNYRALNPAEVAVVFPEAVTAPSQPEATPPPPASLSRERRKQLLLLDKVERYWVNGVLEKSLSEGAVLDLERHRLDTAVNLPWQDILDTAVAEPAPQPILDTFTNADRALLILGAAGAGKTITMISLAQALIPSARTHIEAPIPVILNLVSWAEKRGPLAKWIVAEITTQYRVPRSLGHRWLDEDELVLLLDGLDEVKPKAMEPCIQAINDFREMHGLTGIVVCSRLDAYLTTGLRLNLSGAIELQPLTLPQVESYLAAAGVSIEWAHALGEQDAVLQELAETPLLLRVISTVYQAGTAIVPDTTAQVPARREQIFDAYLAEAYQKPGALLYDQTQSRRWLAWLAQKMNQHNQTVLLLEQIQPSWLPTSSLRRLFLLSSRLIDGFSLGIIIWMFWRLVRLALVDFDLVWSLEIVNQPLLAPKYTNFLLFLSLFLLLGLAAGLVDIFFYEWEGIEEAVLTPRTRRWLRLAAVVGLVFTVSMIFIAIYSEPLVAFSSSLIAAFGFGLTTLYIHGDNYRTDIRTIEALSWSWMSAFLGLVVGALFASLFELLEYQVMGPTPLVRSFISIGLLFFLLGGLRGNRLPATTRPNEGIWLSAASAGVAAGLFGLTMSLLTAFLWSPAFGVIAGILTAWIAGSLYGASSVVNHFWLRFWLYRCQLLPWHVTNFLNEAANRGVLNKVGGGYIFIHRLLQDHFAGLFHSRDTAAEEPGRTISQP